ncbi:MAG: carbohydrate ABC transporter permease [Lachnospiraceae bacterium]|nr:carbohydrate ABC transporter permease [Lachnospiraceae bacterium]MBR3824657.1 carbohydrate ABC transporter permease [Lachnospiraceae bacterium]MBR4059405.1 carbohydrate ABC transporter permease [Lachnospiraceae bacterium]MBR4084339.1 carbohydrate ABC transporter permease [Lachnospiraceae bacterium]MBR6664368.1 carbohydrate ABC transporter permease [Lachnospiraceae bacterium]
MVKEKTKNTRYKTSIWDKMFVVLNYVFLTIVAFIMIYPVINVIAVSLSNYQEYLKSPAMMWPKKFTVSAYELIIKNDKFWRSYINTIFVTVVHTLLGLATNFLFAWPMARKETKGKGFFMALIIFNMVFNAGMIPNYLNIQMLGLLDTLWVLILPGCFTAFNCVVMMSFLRELPYELIEAAMVDGGSEPYILSKVVLPLSKPVLASVALFLAVGSWNSYFSAQIYIRDSDLWPIALVLKEILASATTDILEGGMDPMALMEAEQQIQEKTIQYATVVVSTLPIMCVYPFLQKHFAKGVMVGSVKG